MAAMTSWSKGAVKQAKTWAGRGDDFVWRAVRGENDALDAGWMSTSRPSWAKSSSMAVPGLVVMAKDCTRMRCSATTGPTAYSMGTPAAERMSPTV